ncbi:hypothetical protein LP415_06725 [Polaromonas sp. P1(28)-8]|nr:hypothetical protein LP415_06725 [Polaromonas sp. P1(28)-8]
MFAERFVEQPRHIEVQVFGDTHGRVIHLGERECSIQRRFQKLIEESPAPALPDGLRDRICDAAVKLAAAAGYVNAGTVECIVSPDGEFFFLEMNTRLQVEHPVTEMVTGLDLVELQLRVAQGEPLPIGQADVLFSGHAIECRILAEDADAGFVPDTGRVLLLHAPAGPGVRFDCGVTEGAPVTADFDSMLAKLVVHGADRSLAISRMRSALAETAMLGVTINNDFLSRVLRHPAFARRDRHRFPGTPQGRTGARHPDRRRTPGSAGRRSQRRARYVSHPNPRALCLHGRVAQLSFKNDHTSIF